MARPVNDKCIDCSKISFKGNVVKPDCWAGMACMKKRSYYRKHEHYKQLLRNNHSYLKYKKKECIICHCATNLEVHHVLPICRGGKDIPDNLVTLCKPCHRIITTYHKTIGYIN